MKIQDLAPTTAPPLRHWLSSERSLRTPIFGNFLFLLFFNMEQGASLKLPSEGRIRCKPSARFGCELQRLVGSWGLADSRLTPPPPPPLFLPRRRPNLGPLFQGARRFRAHAGDSCWRCNSAVLLPGIAHGSRSPSLRFFDVDEPRADRY